MRNRSTEAIAEQTDYLRQFADNTSVGVMVGDPATGAALFVNEAAARMFGYTREEMLDIRRDGLFPAFSTELEEALKQRGTNGQFSGRLTGVRKDNTLFPVELYSALYTDEDGSVRATSTLLDLSGQLKAERDLSQAEQNFRLLQEQTEEIFLFIDRNLTISQLNSASIRRISERLQRPVIVGMPVLDLAPEAQRPYLQEIYRRVFGGELVKTEYHVGEGEDRQYYLTIYKPVTTDSGDISGALVTAINITAQKKVEKELERSEQLWRFALEGSHLGVWDWNIPSGTVRYNSVWKTMLGLTDADVQENITDWEQRVHPDDLSRVVEEVKRHFAGETPFYESIHRIRHKEGHYLSILDRGMVTEKEENGAPVRMVGTHIDVTDKVQQEEALRRSNERYAYASRATSDVIYDWDLRTNLLQWGEGFKILFGYESEEVPIQVWETLVHPDDRQRVTDSLAGALLPGTNTIWEAGYRMRTRGGTYKHLAEKGYILRQENGQAERMIGAIQDITDLKEREAHLQQSIERNHYVTLATSDIIWDWNLQTGDILWSDKYSEILGWTLPANNAQPVQNCIDRMHPSEREAVSHRLQAAIADNHRQIWQDSFRYKRADGTYAWVSDRGYIVRDGEGKGVRMIGAMQDITAQRMSAELMKLERAVFELSSNPSVPFPTVVEAHLQGLEAIYPGFTTSVLQLQDNGTVRHLAAPSLPPAFGSSLTAQYLGPQSGSCGAAMHQRRTIIVADTSLDPLWADFRDLAETYTLRAAWSFPIIHSSGRVLGSMAVYRDSPSRPSPEELQMLERHRNILRILMEHQASLEEIRTANERFDIVSQATHDIIWDWNLENNTIHRNSEGVQSVYGLPSNDGITSIYQWLMHVHPDDHARVQLLINEILQSQDRDVFEVEYRFLREDGSYAHVYDRGKILRDVGGKPVRMIGAAQDITERKRLEQQILHQELDRQKAINRATVDTQEGERAEIGRELHDNVNQVLTTTKLYLDLALANPDMKDELIHKSLRNIIGVINEIRQLSRSLMDPSLGDLGLMDSIRDLVDNINLTRRLHVTLESAPGLEDLLSPTGKLTLFRIIQEALNNAIRHARATSVLLRFEEDGTDILLFIEDDGIGFRPEAVKKGAGLKNIENRIYLMNGSYTIDSEPDKGCRLTIKIPL